MLCPVCNGRRLFLAHGQLLPCPECEGHGKIHCCDGLQEQPDGTAAKNEPAENKGTDDGIALIK